MQISNDKDKKGVSSVAEGVENGEILSSSSKWILGLDELFVTCLNDNSENKISKPNKNCLDLFINTSSNHMSITSLVVSQPKSKLNSNDEQWFNVQDFSPPTRGVILPRIHAIKFQHIVKLVR